MSINEIHQIIIDHVGEDVFNSVGIIIFLAAFAGITRLALHIAWMK